MAFTIKPTRKNMQRIQKNTQKGIQKGMEAALDRWTSEGGFVADETKAKMKKRMFIYRKHE